MSKSANKIKCITLVVEGRVLNKYMTKSVAVGQKNFPGGTVSAMGELPQGIAIEASKSKVLVPWSNIASVEYE